MEKDSKWGIWWPTSLNGCEVKQNCQGDSETQGKQWL